MKVKSIAGKDLKTISLPKQFNEEVRRDLIKRAFNAVRSHRVQPKGVNPRAGMGHAVELSKRRRAYKGIMGTGRSRTPRKVMSHGGGMRFSYMGAQAPFTVGGRQAHPPKSWKIIAEKINKKERRKAIRSAISASNILIIEDKFEKLSKTKEVIKALESNGLKIEPNKTLRKGVARLRGRGKRYSKGPLLIVADKCDLSNSGVNIPGVEVARVNELNVKLLAPGSVPGRTTIWTEGSIKKMSEEDLYL